MNKIKLSIVAALLATTSVVTSASASEVEVSANMAMTSNYVWRGMTQSANSPAIQGGVDIGYGGVYAGVWGSNVNFGSDVSLEADFYAGYANEIAGFSYDLNYVQYTYPNDTEASNFGEVSGTLGYDFKVLAVSAKYYMGVKTNDFDAPDGYEASVSVPLPAEISLDATYGDYDTVGTYYLVGASKSFGKFDFNLAYTGISADSGSAADQDNVVLTVGTSF